jgi:hypothetical protein
MAEKASNRLFRDGNHIGIPLPMLTLPNDAALAAGFHKVSSRKMTPIGTPELVLLLVALGGTTAAAIWGVTELTNPRRTAPSASTSKSSSFHSPEGRLADARLSRQLAKTFFFSQKR